MGPGRPRSFHLKQQHYKPCPRLYRAQALIKAWLLVRVQLMCRSRGLCEATLIAECLGHCVNWCIFCLQTSDKSVRLSCLVSEMGSLSS